MILVFFFQRAKTSSSVSGILNNPDGAILKIFNNTGSLCPEFTEFLQQQYRRRTLLTLVLI
jgi:hypothetical protein